MTQADIEEMLRNLAETTCSLRSSSLRMREAAEHLVTVADYLQEIGARTDAAITAGLTHLHGEHEDEFMTKIDAVGTTGEKVTVAPPPDVRALREQISTLTAELDKARATIAHIVPDDILRRTQYNLSIYCASGDIAGLISSDIASLCAFLRAWNHEGASVNLIKRTDDGVFQEITEDDIRRELGDIDA